MLRRLFLCDHLVEVAAHCVAPGAIRKRRGVLLRASMRSLVNVDAKGNRLSDLDTLEPTEFSSNNAWNQNFSNGNENNNNKNNNNYVRAVRK